MIELGQVADVERRWSHLCVDATELFDNWLVERFALFIFTLVLFRDRFTLLIEWLHGRHDVLRTCS